MQRRHVAALRSVVLAGLLGSACVAAADGKPALGARSKLGGSKLYWVRRQADDTKAVQLVRSLAKFCEANELGCDAMLAVAAGEEDVHGGWECGELEEHALDADADADADAEKVETVETVEAEGEAAAEGEATARPAPPALQMNKMIIGMVAPMGATRVLKRYDQTSDGFLRGLRVGFFAVLAFNLAIHLLLDLRIRMAKDETKVVEAANPLAMLMGGGGGGASKTARQYDAAQLKSMRNSFQLGSLVTLFLHFKMKLTQPVVYSSVSGLVDLFFNPLVQIHLLGKSPEGANKRPFGGGNPMAGLGAMGGKPGAGPPPNPFAALLNPGGGKAAAEEEALPEPVASDGPDDSLPDDVPEPST